MLETSPPKRGDLPHQARRQERVLRARRDEERVDAREALVHLRHLQLVVEVGDGPEALHDRVGAVVPGEVDEQALEELDPDVAEVRGRPRVSISWRSSRREQRLRLLRVADDRDDDVVEVPRGALDDVEVTEGDRVERTRAEGGRHAGLPVRSADRQASTKNARAYRRTSAPSRLGSPGGRRDRGCRPAARRPRSRRGASQPGAAERRRATRGDRRRRRCRTAGRRTRGRTAPRRGGGPAEEADRRRRRDHARPVAEPERRRRSRAIASSARAVALDEHGRAPRRATAPRSPSAPAAA